MSQPKKDKLVLGQVENGAIGTTVSKAKTSAKKEEVVKPKEDKVAIYSSKNVSWSGVGKLNKGYNIVTKAASEKWLTRNHTRLATPQEVAKEFGL